MPHYDPGVVLASIRNEYQEYFLGVKVAGAQGWQPCHLYLPIVLKSGSLNLLEPSGPVRAFNGIALPLSHIHATAFYPQRISSDTYWKWKTIMWDRKNFERTGKEMILGFKRENNFGHSVINVVTKLIKIYHITLQYRRKQVNRNARYTSHPTSKVRCRFCLVLTNRMFVTNNLKICVI
jgi:hypothetical protein